MTKLIRKLRKNEEGATAIEYGLIAALIAVVLVGTLTALGTALDDLFGDVGTKIEGATEEAAAPTP
ncbi:Flp family type IVb pilin [Gimibacter soli]|uniref:Flp family type IVb pilin n=1 Tax=Gimibacter soli TaxID=3024400 RepID=A0AAE9XPV3_9PROT|nr:Flp family type IVb pilin [Gimibacter soli]WCL55058.1 Flp family type IVb pilin [Gimibacter soli]